LVNSTDITLDYRVERVGPSGIGKVDIWITHDQGNSWRRLAEESPRKSPFPVALPGEGLFGLRLVASNGNGFGGNPPRPGDDAHFWVEVDTTSPLVQLGNIDPNSEGGNLVICWNAQDRNLNGNPITLWCRGDGDSTWQLIARNLKNTGQHRWQFPRDKGDRFYLRVEACDEAGNKCHAETPTPIVLDMIEPQLILIGVAAKEPRQAAPNFAPPMNSPATVQPAAPSRPDPLQPLPPGAVSGIIIQN